MPFTSSFDLPSDEPIRSYDPNDVQGASYRILSELGQGKDFQEVLTHLGQRRNDPENFVAESTLSLISQIRLFLSARIPRKTSDLSGDVMSVGEKLSRAFPEIDFSPEEIASIVPLVRDRLKMTVNHHRVHSHRFPL
ncbi:hypothetical protein KAR91_19405 [Candidatus Pacearchaeota archaeon]|nr:hypothetical protein [Candidatus Pacearchaeota archaeon]